MGEQRAKNEEERHKSRKAKIIEELENALSKEELKLEEELKSIHDLDIFNISVDYKSQLILCFKKTVNTR